MLPYAVALGTLRSAELDLAHRRVDGEDSLLEGINAGWISPFNANPALRAINSPALKEPAKLADLAKRPEISLEDLLRAVGFEYDAEAIEWVGVELKYAGYVAKERASVERVRQMERCLIPRDLDYSNLRALSYESREKLQAVRPGSLGQASRVPGVSPSDIQNLLAEILRLGRREGVSRETYPSP
jgi:tRNA uridine 5-carboxymethylaminomethyl modification enzyme